MVNATNITALPAVPANLDLFALIVGLALVVIMAFIAYKVFKNLVVNAIFGGIGLLALHFFIGPFMGLDIPVSIGNMLIALIAGLPGLVIIVLLALMSISV